MSYTVVDEFSLGHRNRGNIRIWKSTASYKWHGGRGVDNIFFFGIQYFLVYKDTLLYSSQLVDFFPIIPLRQVESFKVHRYDSPPTAMTPRQQQWLPANNNDYSLWMTWGVATFRGKRYWESRIWSLISWKVPVPRAACPEDPCSELRMDYFCKLPNIFCVYFLLCSVVLATPLLMSPILYVGSCLDSSPESCATNLAIHSLLSHLSPYLASSHPSPYLASQLPT